MKLFPVILQFPKRCSSRYSQVQTRWKAERSLVSHWNSGKYVRYMPLLASHRYIYTQHWKSRPHSIHYNVLSAETTSNTMQGSTEGMQFRPNLLPPDILAKALTMGSKEGIKVAPEPLCVASKYFSPCVGPQKILSKPGLQSKTLHFQREFSRCILDIFLCV